MADASSRRSPPGWLFDELASAGRENLDVDHASRYDAKEDAGAGEELALLGRLGLHSRSEVVDIGAGTGQFAIAAASACSSGRRRRLARDAAAAESQDQRVGTVERRGGAGGLLTYEHLGRAPDFVYSRYALHHLPDFWKALALERVRRIIRPGGVLRLWDVVYNFDPAEAEERIEAWCATGGGDVEGGWSRAELEEHVRDEHSTFSWLLEAMITRAGFALQDALYSPDGIFAKYVARAT